MPGTFSYKVLKAHEAGETIRIHRRNGTASGRLNAISFTDKDTKHIIFYIPSLDMSSYGNTMEEAYEMMQDSLDFYFSNLIKMKPDACAAELRKYGWVHQPLAKKEYAHAFVDISGRLQEFNAQDDKIEHHILEAA